MLAPNQFKDYNLYNATRQDHVPFSRPDGSTRWAEIFVDTHG